MSYVTGGGPNTVRYVRRYPDGTVYAQEHQIKGNKLEFRSLWKQTVGGAMVMVLSVASSPEEDSEEE